MHQVIRYTKHAHASHTKYAHISHTKYTHNSHASNRGDKKLMSHVPLKREHYSLPNNNFLDWTKFKAFADDKLKVAKMNLRFLSLIG